MGFEAVQLCLHQALLAKGYVIIEDGISFVSLCIELIGVGFELEVELLAHVDELLVEGVLKL